MGDIKRAVCIGLVLSLGIICSGCATESKQTEKWLQGYQTTITGGIIDYHSPQPDVTSALLVRSINSEDHIGWETEVIPKDYPHDIVTFIWIFGMDVDIHPHDYDLIINQRQWFRFSNPKTSKAKQWTLNGPHGSTLTFRVTKVDQHGDVFGYAALTLPMSAFSKGKALQMKVVGETAASRVWYMTFQSPVHTDWKVVPQSALLKSRNRLLRPVHIHYVHLGEPMPAQISVPGLPVKTTELEFGFNEIEMQLPDSPKIREQSVEIRVGTQKSVKKSFQLKPVRKWYVYLVQHTHTDIGYTRPQTEILADHIRFLDYALDLCDATDSFPDDARFRWTCESSWAVNEYLNTRPLIQVDRLKKRIQEGRIEVTGMIYNMSEIADENILAASLKPIQRIKAAGLPIYTAMQNDVNGIAWCLADFFPECGLKYLTMGQHGHRALIPFTKPTAFWWESPSGKRLLAFRADHYNTGNYWGIHTGQFGVTEKGLLQYLDGLAEKDYPYDRIAVQYAGYFTDNSPPAIVGCEFIKTWNQKYAWPKLRSATSREFLAHLEAEHGADLPVHRVAWPDWWSDGFGSAARETAAARKTQMLLLANQGLLTMSRLLGSDLPKSVFQQVAKIQNALLFWDEHTMGAAESVSDPLSQNSIVQWAEKAAYVWEAAKDTRLLQEAAMGLIEPYLSQHEVPVISVFNTLGWNRSGLIEVYVNHEILPPGKDFRLYDENGKDVSAQKSFSRADGTYWNFWLEDIPAFGFRTYRLEIQTTDRSPPKTWEPQENLMENEFYRLKFDLDTGAIISLVDKQSQKQLIDTECPWHLGQFIHETISNRSQLERFRLVSCSRQGVKKVIRNRGVNGPIWNSLFFSGETDTAVTGKPLEWEIRLYNTAKRLELHYSLVKKNITEPEAIYVAFPILSPGGHILYETIGGNVIPGENQLEGTSSDWHAVQNFVAVQNQDGQIILGSDEIPLMQFGDLNLGKFQYVAKVENPYIFSWVMNNYWVTNFRASQEGQFHWKYYLTSSEDPSVFKAVQYGWESRVPLLSRVIPPGRKRKGLQKKSFLQIDPENILLVSAQPIAESPWIRLHVREINGQDVTFRLSSEHDALTKFRVIPVDVLENPLKNFPKTEKIKAYETRFFLVSW